MIPDPRDALASSTGGVKSQNSADRISPSEIGYKAGKSNFSRKVRSAEIEQPWRTDLQTLPPRGP
ncbi:hypothetical protein CC2G_001998 [Coprinopsis cinerea AmutBmut pab1-1]|nr:hypothetical protein CC2G_001998 [Coprinopsis cinerea AmutBmut pab1-1]